MNLTIKLTARDPSFAIVDGLLEPPNFSQFSRHFADMDFAYRSITGWQKVWRINDGQILAGTPQYHSRTPSGGPMDWLMAAIHALAKQEFGGLVGEEGKDWKDILLTPYIYPSGTKISWHNDAGYAGAAIFYPHGEWNPHWGGELMVAKTPKNVEFSGEKDIGRNYVAPILNEYGYGTYISPLPNRLVFTAGDCWHSINRVDSAAGDHVRCSVVAFFLKEKI